MAKSFFPMVSTATLRSVTAASRAGVAEKLAERELARKEQKRKDSEHTETPVPVVYTPEDFARLIAALFQARDVVTFPFIANIIPVQVRPAEKRAYVCIQNQSATVQMTVGFGKPPSALVILPVDGIILPTATANSFGVYEPLIKPQGTIWIGAGADATPGAIVIGFL